MIPSNEEVEIHINGSLWRFYKCASGLWNCTSDEIGITASGETIVEAVEAVTEVLYVMLMDELEEYGIVEDDEEVLYEDDLDDDYSV